MGYRSQVAFALDKGLYLKYHMLMQKFPKTLSTGKRLEHENAYYWFFDDWKWYPNYEEVKCIEDFIDTLEKESDQNSELIQEKDAYVGYGFLRIGEDIEDIEMRGDSYDYALWIQREIDTPFGMMSGIEETN